MDARGRRLDTPWGLYLDKLGTPLDDRCWETLHIVQPAHSC